MRAIDADRLLKMMSHWKPYMDMDKVRKAVQNMPTLTPPNEWVSVENSMPPEHETVLCIVSGKPNPNITLEDAYQLGSWNKADGWIIDEWLDWEGANVTWWMKLPAPPDKDNNVPAKTPNEPLTCGLVDRHGMPLRAGDTVAADKFFVYAVRYGSHNVNPDNCAPAYQVGWYLEIMWAYPGFEDSVGHTEPLYDIDGTAARYPAHCADTADGLNNLKLEVCCRPPEGGL